MIGGEAARRYAKALVEIADAGGALDKTGEELAALATATENPELRRVLMNPRFSRSVRCEIIDGILESMGAGELIRKFAQLVSRKDRIADLPGIAERYTAQADELKGRVRAQVRTAYDLPDAAQEELRRKLSEMSGKEVILEVEKDETLIGGLVCRMGGVVMDGSVRNQLKNLRENLIAN